MRTFEKYQVNLRVHGDKVYSYDTDVADINHIDRTVTPNKYYSVTTSKHINYVANEYGYKVNKQNI